MNKKELAEALALAKSSFPLPKLDFDLFEGYGNKGFKPVVCTIDQLAALIRWQCINLNGTIDTEELNDLAQLGRKRFLIVSK